MANIEHQLKGVQTQMFQGQMCRVVTPYNRILILEIYPSSWLFYRWKMKAVDGHQTYCVRSGD